MLLKSRYIHYYVIASCLVAVAIDLTMATMMNRQSLLTSTISDLAAGDFDIAQDIGLILVALGIALTGLVVWRTGDDGWPTITSASLLGLAGPLIVLISLYEAYSKSSPAGPLLHYWVVGAIGLAISAAMALLSWTRSEAHWVFRWGTALAAIMFLAAGAATFGVSNEIIGLVERSAAVALVLWLIGFHAARLASKV
ncbi:MAG: DUF998 domain-containing protein [Henriciella sp.]|uniref:DUF998 domain-containing protein n=1 Tax=Henriciella sp. TaxID=1968823 RepID=UPI003C72EC1A